MKRVVLMIGGMVIATSSFAGVGEYSGETTCHVFHKNKLLKTLKCSYEATEGASSTDPCCQIRRTKLGRF